MIDEDNIVTGKLDSEQDEAIKKLIYNHIRDIIDSPNMSNDKVIEDYLVMQMSNIIKEFFSKYKIDLGKLKFVTADKDSEKTIYFIYIYYNNSIKDIITYKVEIYDWEIYALTKITDSSSDIGDMKFYSCTKKEEFSIPTKTYRHKIDIVYKMYLYRNEY